MHEYNAHVYVSTQFVYLNYGMLHPSPLKTNFVLEVQDPRHIGKWKEILRTSSIMALSCQLLQL